MGSVEGGEVGRMGFHISRGSFSMGMVAGTKVGELQSWAVDIVAGIEDCQLSLMEKVTKEEDEDILRAMGEEEDGRRKRWRSQ